MFDSVVCSHGVDRGNFTFLSFMQNKCVKYNNDSYFPSPALKPWQSFKYLEKTVTNRNCIHEKIKSRLYWRKVYLHSVPNVLFLAWSLRSGRVNVKIIKQLNNYLIPWSRFSVEKLIALRLINNLFSIHYHVHKSLLITIVNCLPVHTFPSFFYKVYFYIIQIVPKNPVTKNYNFVSCFVWI